MILDYGLSFTGAVAIPGTTLKFADNVTTTGATSNFYLDLALGQTSTAGANPVGGLPPAQSTPNTQPFRDLGIGDDPAMKILVQCTTAFSGGTNIVVNFQGAPDSGTGTQGSYSTYYASPSYTIAGGFLVPGARLMDMDVPRPPAGVPEPRYLKLNFAITGTMSGSNIFGAIVLDRFDQVYNAFVNSVSGGYVAGVTVAN